MANGRGAPRRSTAWDDSLYNFSLGSSSQTDQELMQAVNDPEKRGCTLIRTIVNLWLAPQDPGIASGFMLADMGIALISPDARVADAYPDPEAAGDYPVTGWVWRDRIVIMNELLSTGVVVPSRVQLDLRSSRKLDRADPVFIITNSVGLGGGFVTQVMGIIRMLYKLP